MAECWSALCLLGCKVWCLTVTDGGCGGGVHGVLFHGSQGPRLPHTPSNTHLFPLLAPSWTRGMTLCLRCHLSGDGGPSLGPVWTTGADVVWTTTTEHALVLVVLSGGSSAAAVICLDYIRLNSSSYQLSHTLGLVHAHMWFS